MTAFRSQCTAAKYSSLLTHCRAGTRFNCCKMNELERDAKANSDRSGAPSEKTIAMLQVLITELSTIAFVASIVATICFPNLLAPAQQWTMFDFWIADGNDPTAPIPDNTAYMRQWTYGFLWCFASMSSVLSVMSSLGLALSIMAVARSGDELDRMVAFYKRTPTAAYVTRSWPLRRVFEPFIDGVLLLCSCFTSYRPCVWSMPYVHLTGAVVMLAFALSYNIYFLLPAWIWTHVASAAGGLPLVYLYVRMGQSGGEGELAKAEAWEASERRRLAGTGHLAGAAGEDSGSQLRPDTSERQKARAEAEAASGMNSNAGSNRRVAPQENAAQHPQRAPSASSSS